MWWLRAGLVAGVRGQAGRREGGHSGPRESQADEGG